MIDQGEVFDTLAVFFLPLSASLSNNGVAGCKFQKLKCTGSVFFLPFFFLEEENPKETLVSCRVSDAT